MFELNPLLSDLTSMKTLIDKKEQTIKDEYIKEKNLHGEIDTTFIMALSIVEQNLEPQCFRSFSMCCDVRHTMTRYQLNYNGKSYSWDKLLTHTYEKHNSIIDSDFIKLIKEVGNKIWNNDTETIDQFVNPSFYHSLKHIRIDHTKSMMTVLSDLIPKPVLILSEQTFESFSDFIECMDWKDYIIENENENDYSYLLKHDEYKLKNPFYLMKINFPNTHSFKLSNYDLLYGFVVDSANIDNLESITIILNKDTNIICSLKKQEILEQIKIQPNNNKDYFIFNFTTTPIPINSTSEMSLYIKTINNSYSESNVFALLRKSIYKNYLKNAKTSMMAKTNVLLYNNGLLTKLSEHIENDTSTAYVYKLDSVIHQKPLQQKIMVKPKQSGARNKFRFCNPAINDKEFINEFCIIDPTTIPNENEKEKEINPDSQSKKLPDIKKYGVQIIDIVKYADGVVLKNTNIKTPINKIYVDYYKDMQNYLTLVAGIIQNKF